SAPWLLDSLIGAFDRLEDRVCPGPHAAREVTRLEVRRDLLADDAGRFQVRQCAFEAIADLNPELPFLERNEEKDAVVGPFLTELPGGRDAMGVLLERLSLEGREDQDGDLIAGLLFVRLELFCQLRGVIHGENAGKIYDAPGQRRDVQRSKRHRKEEQQP